MKRIEINLVALALGGALSVPVAGADLMETYRLARQSDPTFSASRAQRDAGLERLPQARAGLLPTLNASANTNWNEATNRTSNFSRDYNSNGWTVQLTQPLFRWQNIMQWRQGEYQVLQAEAVFGQANQDLILRVAQAYFDVLAAQDNLDFTKSNKIAIAEQLAQAKRNFEVGTATITDTNEAQARFDIANAQEIAGLNDLEIRQRALQQITGVFPDDLKRLRDRLEITPPQPNAMDKWVEQAQTGSFGVKAQEAALEIAKKEAERQRAGHLPTIDATATAQDNVAQNVALLTGTRSNVRQDIYGLVINLPIYAGGSVLSKTREAVALEEKARQDLDASRRSAEFNTRQSFLNVVNGLAQVKALEQALVSSEVSLASNRVGYDVGVRINIDVLNAQQQVFQTKRDLAKARYDTILNGFKLKSAIGSLSEEDVARANLLLGQ